MSYIQTLYQVVFSTKDRQTSLTGPRLDDLYRYISRVLQDRRCAVHQVGGHVDHIHIIMHLHPSESLSDVMRDVKSYSSKWMKERGFFPGFEGWQEGYAAFTYTQEAKSNLIRYVQNQEFHHQNQSSLDEIRQLLKEFHVEYDEKYLI